MIRPDKPESPTKLQNSTYSMKFNRKYLILAGSMLVPFALFAQEAAERQAVPAAEPAAAPAETVAPAEEAAAPATEAVPAEEEKIGKAVRVSASRHEMDLSDVPLSVSVVSGEEVERSSAATVADLLDDVPGVQVSNNGPAGVKYVNIRGEGNNRTVILVDGQRVTEQKSMEGIPLLIAVQDIERVEVIKGPASVLYGSDAIGGVVNVITKKGPKEDGVHGSAGVRGDSGSHGIDQNYSLSGRYGDFAARLAYSDEDHGDVVSPKGTLHGSDYRLQNTSALLSYDISEDATFGIKIEAFRGRVNAYSGEEGFHPSMPSWDRDKVGLFLDVKDITKTFVKFHVDAYFQKTDKDFLQEGSGTETYYGMTLPYEMEVTTRNKLYTYGVNAQADFDFGSNYLIVGAMIDYQDLEATTSTDVDLDFSSVRPDYGVRTMSTTRPDDASVLTAAIYAQDEFNFAEGWNLVLGARGTYVKNELDSTTKTTTNPMTLATTVTEISSESDEDANATFSISLVNTQIENWTFRGTISQGYRYATINELYIGSAMGGVSSMGSSTTMTPNPDLDPETSTNYELGVRFNNDKLNADVTLFFTDSDDYIANVTQSDGSVMPDNVESAQSFGVEFSVSYRFELGEDAIVVPYAVGTFMRRKYDDGEDSTYNTNTPKIYGKIGVRGALADGNLAWWADANMRASSAAQEWVEDEEYDAGGYMDRTHGWSTFNISAGVDITPEKYNPYFAKLSIAVGIDNIFDRAYQVAGYSDGFWQTGRSYWASLKYEF